MTFRLYPLRFEFVAREAVRFAAGAPANILRGAFGMMFRKVAGEAEYARFFSPRADAGPAGLHDRPRPFVFRAGHLDGATVEAGERFHFGMNVFAMRNPPLQYLVEAFSRLATEGLGNAGARVVLVNPPALELLELPLAKPDLDVSKMKVRFVTPLELKSAGLISGKPEFAILAARARDRLSTLRALYDAGPLELDFRDFARRAETIKMTNCQVKTVSAERRSSRTGQRHPLGGLVGEAEYEGDLTEFLPYLKAAEWTGVGRQTAWGKGQIEVC